MSKIGPGTLVLGIFAVLFGLVGAYGMKQYLAEQTPEAPPEPPRVRRVNIPVASIDLATNRTVTFGDIMILSMTPEEARERDFPPLIMMDSGQVIGRTLRGEVTKGSPFVTEGFFPEGTGPSVAERLEPGYRAVSVSLDNSEAEIALLSPGAVADVVFRTTPQAGNSLPETTVTLLENIELLAVGETIFPGGRASGNGRYRGTTPVTLSCTPDQASALKVVEQRGSLSLILRNPNDVQLVGHSPPRTLESLLQLPEVQPAVTTQIYRRGRMTTSVFEQGRHMVVSESFGGLPVAAEKPRGTPPVTPISYSTTSSRVAANTTAGAAAGEPCGCGDK